MKKKYTLFYSWQSDSPSSDNWSYIEKELERCKTKFAEQGIEIEISQDAREDTDGDSIDRAVLVQIARSDFFVGDITPIATTDKAKIVPNPNVMFEVGYAASQLGMQRVILAWNTAYYPLNAPFDIRNYAIVKYSKKKKECKKALDLYDIMEKKIEKYNELVADEGKAINYDVRIYKQIEDIIPMQTLREKVEFFLRHRIHSKYDLDLMDDLYHSYGTDLRFLDNDLHVAFQNVLTELVKVLQLDFAYGEEIRRPSYDLNPSATNDDRIAYNKEITRKIRDAYRYNRDSKKAYVEEEFVLKSCQDFHRSFSKQYDEFRQLIRKKLYI